MTADDILSTTIDHGLLELEVATSSDESRPPGSPRSLHAPPLCEEGTEVECRKGDGRRHEGLWEERRWWRMSVGARVVGGVDDEHEVDEPTGGAKDERGGTCRQRGGQARGGGARRRRGGQARGGVAYGRRRGQLRGGRREFKCGARMRNW